MSRIYVAEPGRTGGPGAMGAKLLAARLAASGHTVTHVRLTSEDHAAQGLLLTEGEHEMQDVRDLAPPDAWFISTIYTRQWVYLRSLHEQIGVPLWTRDRTDAHPLVVYGGQTSFAPEPIADFADIVALGDGELTGLQIAEWLDRGHSRSEVMELAHSRGGIGYYVPSEWPGTARPTLQRWDTPRVEPLVVYPGTVDRVNPTIEVARGCRSKCAFCPIGWAGGPYRESDRSLIEGLIDGIRRRGRAQVNLFAPDYSSVSYVDDLDRYAASVGCSNHGTDARLDRAERHLAAGGTVKSFAFGIEGPSERLRSAIGKPLSTEQILVTMARLSATRVRWYVILGLPGEDDSDTAELRGTLLALDHRGMLNVTQTCLQPVPHTPLERVDAHYPARSAERGLELRAWARDVSEQRGSIIALFSQPKGPHLHEHDAIVHRGGREMARYLAIATASDGAVSSGRWRDAFVRADLDAERYLAPIGVDTPTPWDFVCVGSSSSARAKAIDAYWHRFRVASCRRHGSEPPAESTAIEGGANGRGPQRAAPISDPAAARP